MILDKEIAKKVTKHLFYNLIALMFVGLIVAALFGIFHLADKIHWLFYGLIPIFMWIIVYILALLTKDDALHAISEPEDKDGR